MWREGEGKWRLPLSREDLPIPWSGVAFNLVTAASFCDLCPQWNVGWVSAAGARQEFGTIEARSNEVTTESVDE
jgi:hypothetical protein